MAEATKSTGIDRVFDLISRIWKMLLIVVIIGGVVVSISRTWDKIDGNGKNLKEVDDKYNARIREVDERYNAVIKEMIRDNKVQLDDQHELIIKNIQRVSELREDFNRHEISAAEFRGRVKALLKISQ